MPTPTVFISYSHKDGRWRDLFAEHLEVLKKEVLLEVWHDKKIGAGDKWETKIRKAMAIADVAVLLVSRNSLGSDFILNVEIPYLLERQSKDGMRFMPIIVEDCLWRKLEWISSLQVRPEHGRPLENFRGKLNAELVNLCDEILALARKVPELEDHGKSETPSQILSPLQALHQLPPPPRDFTGRQEELASLKEKLTQGGAGAIFGLRGMGGVGKTTLALKLAEELTPLYPDAQIYLDLKGVDPQPLTSAQAMAHVIRSFHPEVKLPEDQVQLAGLYRSVLHDKRTILLMDNASRDGRAQLEPLIPPAGSLLLVTSRFHFTLPGLVPKDLDEMTQKEACDLLLRIADRIGADADEIARLCGRLPLALRLAGSALTERPTLSPADYISRLSEGKDRLEGVNVSLRTSYELLAEEQRKLWRLLAVFPHTFGMSAATAVWELDHDSTEDALEKLIRYSLVEWKEGRFRLHDLARNFASQQCEAEELNATRMRHALYYMQLLAGADKLYESGQEFLAVSVFDVERSNIQAGQEWATEQSKESAVAAELCNRYPNEGTYILRLRLHPREQILWREAALEAARRLGDRDREATHLGNLGIAYMALKEPSRAINFYEQRLAIAREIGDRHGEGKALGNLASAYGMLGDFDRAIEVCEKRLTIAREIGDQRGEGNALGILGNMYTYLGEPQKAMEFYEQHLALARASKDRRGEASAAWNLGVQYAAQGELSQAIDFMEICVNYEREIGHPEAEEHAASIEAYRILLQRP